MTNIDNMAVMMTESLRKLVLQQTADWQTAAQMLVAMIEGFQLRSKEHPREAPDQIARRLHQGINLVLAEDGSALGDPNIQCRKGCSHCCYMRVGVSPQEGVQLLQIASRQQIALDVERLAAQATSNDEADWLAMPYDLRRCVFLGADGGCQVYEQRPISCRKYFVITDPQGCDTRIQDNNNKDNVGVLADAKAEIIASAVATHYGIDSLPRQLLRAMKGGT